MVWATEPLSTKLAMNQSEFPMRDIWRVYLEMLRFVITGSSLLWLLSPEFSACNFFLLSLSGCGPGDRRRPQPQQEEERRPRRRGRDLHEEPWPAKQPEPWPRPWAGARRHPGAQEAHQNFWPREVGDQTGGSIQYGFLHTLRWQKVLKSLRKTLNPFLKTYFITCQYSCSLSALRWLLPMSCPKRSSLILTMRQEYFLKWMMKRVRNYLFYTHHRTR